MKLIVPVYDNTSIAEGFNSTPDVCIFDPEMVGEASCTFVPWRQIIPPGSKITKVMRELGIGAVLTSQIQLLALNLFVEQHIQVYKSFGTDLHQNLVLYSQNELRQFGTSDALESASICSGSCSDCSDDKCH